jgi:hypothetical protein
MKVVDIVYWILNAIMLASIVYGIIMRRRIKKMVLKSIEVMNKRTDEFCEQYNARATLLSKENNKLRNENEMLKERLRDLGIKDFDVL